jgi:methyl-accepting chemotaxis protein
MMRLHLRLTHKIMAIGLVGLLGLLAFGAIYQIGSRSQEASRAIAADARAISDLNKQLLIDLLEARRNEKNFRGAATQEISRNIQQAARGTSQVSSNITDVQHGASETGSASSQVHSAARSLSSESNRLKLEVGKFLDTVRAA